MTPAEQEQQEVAEARKQILGPFGRAILTKTPQGMFLVAPDDMFVGRELCFDGTYSAQELKVLSSLCNNTTRLLVLGAHIGALTIPLAKICGSVIAVEANPHTFELLRLNVLLNGVQNCRVINKAAGHRVEPIEFIANRINSGGSKRSPVVKHPAYFYDNPEIVVVEAVPMDSLLSQMTFDIVLIDIEGSEYFALQGMQRILAGASVLQIEFLPHHLQNVSGASVEDFVALIAPHFAAMCIIDKQLVVPREQFLSTLSDMFARDEGNSGLLFFKVPPDAISFKTSSPP